MDVTHIGINICIFIVVMCLLITGISCTVERTIRVTENVCNQTYEIDTSQDYILSFMPNNPFTDDDLTHTFKECIITFVNDRRRERLICIKNYIGMTYADRRWCDKAFKYYTGYIPIYDSFQSVYTCANFRHSPLCTTRSRVFAVFGNEPASSIFPIKMKIYMTSEAEITTRRTTTWDWHDDDDDYNTDDEDSTLEVFVKVGISSLVVFILLYVCCSCCRTKSLTSQGGTTTCNEEHEQMQGLQQPWPTPQTNNPDVQYLQRPWEETQINTNAQEAPPYSTVMENQHLYLYNDEKSNRIHNSDHQIASPNVPTDPPPLETQTQTVNQPGTNNSIEGQTIPTVPPPDYSDLPPPPPYPGT